MHEIHDNLRLGYGRAGGSPHRRSRTVRSPDSQGHIWVDTALRRGLLNLVYYGTAHLLRRIARRWPCFRLNGNQFLISFGQSHYSPSSFFLLIFAGLGSGSSSGRWRVSGCSVVAGGFSIYSLPSGRRYILFPSLSVLV